MGDCILTEEQIDLAAQLIEVLNTGAINLESNIIYESKLTSIARLKECRDVFLSEIFALIKTSEKTDRKFDESFIYSILEDKKKAFDSLGSGYYIKFMTFTNSSCFKINFIYYIPIKDIDKIEGSSVGNAHDINPVSKTEHSIMRHIENCTNYRRLS